MSRGVYPQVEGLSNENIARIREAFSTFDRDGEGKILARELGSVMRALGHDPSPAEVTDMLNEVDFEGTGLIGFADFQILMAKRVKNLSMADELKDAFRVFDKDKRGFVSTNDFKQVLLQLGDHVTPEDAEEMIREADQNRYGYVEYAELINAMVHK